MGETALLHAIRRLAAKPLHAALIGGVLLLGAAAPAPVTPQFEHWIDGTAATEPETQIQSIDADTFVIRQSVKTNFEAPFLYLIFGKDRALLIDSGAGGLKICFVKSFLLVPSGRKVNSDNGLRAFKA
ncbi:hypothetical protein [Sphingobium phenoxybenzoativorans]|uniref:hypothetical protein n=1 Tax=Sphingobium phenoxybenzoativorans TaxID=1592790 RepID=UPI000872F315